MIAGLNTQWQALLGTLFTWGVTAAGAALVFVIKGGQRKILDLSLGFAAGVMLAASYWSLLAPAIEMSESVYGQWTFIHISVGFSLGGLFVYLADLLMSKLGESSSTDILESIKEIEEKKIKSSEKEQLSSSDVRQRQKGFVQHEKHKIEQRELENGKRDREKEEEIRLKRQSWRRILLMIIAITVHNIPEGLAVGVGFGAIGKSPIATFENARNLAIGIALQNFPEGLAVSLPLNAAGVGPIKSFWYGQLSGMVEPVAGVLGAIAVTLIEPLLPYALAFAAGAMIYVVIDDIIPEGCASGNGRLCSLGGMIGFVVMMALDVGLS